MGGLIARYALTNMENKGKKHGIKTHLSVDTPHRGAVVPLAVQYFLDSFNGFAEAIKMRDAVLNSPAAKQMLLVHYPKDWYQKAITPKPHEDFHTFFEELKSIGNYPKIRNLAVASGWCKKGGQGFNPGASLFCLNARLAWANPLSAVPAKGSQSEIFKGGILRNWSGKVNSEEAFDSLSGGTGDFVKQVYDAVQKLRWFRRLIKIKLYHGDTCFIPSVSAVDQPGPLDRPITGVAATPFAAIFCEEKNEKHVYVSKKCAAWIGQQLGF